MQKKYASLDLFLNLSMNVMVVLRELCNISKGKIGTRARP